MSTEIKSVETYEMFSAITGRRIRTATKVILANGEEIRFTERMSKREAVRNVEFELARR
jgi:fructose-specific phosphotransferase system component IIB